MRAFAFIAALGIAVFSLPVLAGSSFGRAVETDPSGVGSEQSDHRTIRFQKNLRFAEQGEDWAQSIVGVAYFTGSGVEQDFNLARHWFQLAADQGFAEAQYNLGLMFINGKGVTRDFLKGIHWYHEAADQGFVSAQYFLGNIYYKGKGVDQDYAQAADWWRRAAENGVVSAQGNLGAIYYDGEGVPQDFLECYAWTSLAVSGGHERSRHNRDLCASKLDSDGLDLAEAKAAEYAMWYGKD